MTMRHTSDESMIIYDPQEINIPASSHFLDMLSYLAETDTEKKKLTQTLQNKWQDNLSPTNLATKKNYCYNLGRDERTGSKQFKTRSIWKDSTVTYLNIIKF